MIPSNRWLPVSLAERAAWFLNFVAQFIKIASDLGFTPAEVAIVVADGVMMQFVAANDVSVPAYSKAVTQFRKIITEGEIGQPTPDFPADSILVDPANCATGLFERLNDLRTAIMLKPNYTDDIGALLGILVSPIVPPNPDTVKPTVEGFAAETDSHFSVVVGNRQQANTFDVLIRRKGETNWTVAKTASGKSVDVFVALTTPGVPEILQVRIQLKKNNLDYGQLSDTIFITINP